MVRRPLDAMPLPELVERLESTKFFSLDKNSREVLWEAARRLRMLSFERDCLMLQALRTRTPKEIGRIIDEAWKASKEARPKEE